MIFPNAIRTYVILYYKVLSCVCVCVLISRKRLDRLFQNFKVLGQISRYWEEAEDGEGWFEPTVLKDMRDL